MKLLPYVLRMFIISVMGISLLTSCSNDTQVDKNPIAYDYYVDATSGYDANVGSSAFPIKTITHALSLAANGNTVKVNPGLYDTTNGETFPLEIPEGVILIGDEDNKGTGSTSTEINGGGIVYSTYTANLKPGKNSTVAGFLITGPSSSMSNFGVFMSYDGITVRNNTITNSASSGIYFYSYGNALIQGNKIILNTGPGIGFINGGAGTVVENNIIKNNSYGVEYDDSSGGGDLGGGPEGSTGGNTISCNTGNDLWTNKTITINAKNNAWDHNPLSGNDIFNIAGATINTDNATIADDNCP